MHKIYRLKPMPRSERKTIGGSDLACLLGIGFQSPYSLFLSKTGHEIEQTEQMRIGKGIEKAIFELSGIKGTMNEQSYSSSGLPTHFHITPDFVTTDPKIGEIKNVVSAKEFTEDKIPVNYALQTMLYMEGMGIYKLIFVVLAMGCKLIINEYTSPQIAAMKYETGETYGSLYLRAKTAAEPFYKDVMSGNAPKIQTFDDAQRHFQTRVEPKEPKKIVATKEIKELIYEYDHWTHENKRVKNGLEAVKNAIALTAQGADQIIDEFDNVMIRYQMTQSGNLTMKRQKG